MLNQISVFFQITTECCVHLNFLLMRSVEKRYRSLKETSRQLKVLHGLRQLRLLLGCLEIDEEHVLKQCIYALNILDFSCNAMKKLSTLNTIAWPLVGHER